MAARFQHAWNWDTLDQRAWMQRIPTDLPEVQPGGSFKALYYGMHGPYSAFKTAVAADGTHATVHGYQLPLDGTNCTTFLGCPALDVYTMSASGGGLVVIWSVLQPRLLTFIGLCWAPSGKSMRC